MIRLYDRDADAVAAILRLVVAFRRANISETLPDAAEALRHWDLTDIVEAEPKTKPGLIDARLKSIIDAIEEQLPEERRTSSPPVNLRSD
jgi:hypothetical protein